MRDKHTSATRAPVVDCSVARNVGMGSGNEFLTEGVAQNFRKP